VRIPFPERIPIEHVALFAAGLFAVQTLEGTAFYFRVGCLIFLLLAGFAFNTAGGLTRASGAYVFFYSTLVVVVGLCYKAFLGEPAESNLLDPRTGIEVYDAGMAAMLAAVIVSRRFARKTGLLQGMLRDSNMYRSSIGCIIFGAIGPFLIAMLGESSTQLQSAFGQLNELIPLGIIIGVMHEIRRSGGTRSINLLLVLAVAYYFLFYGALGFSKQGMLTPLYCWLVPACALRFRLSVVQLVCCALTVFVVFHYLVPFAQYGRDFIVEGTTTQQRIDIATRLLEHPSETRKGYEEEQEALPAGAPGEYYNRPQGFWDRLEFISIDDPLINITDQGRVIGFAPIVESFVNAVPHFIWPNKPHPIYGGNYYAHEINGQERYEGDTTTGISFSPTAEAYHMAKWEGVLVVAPLIWCIFFVVFDSLLGDLRTTPWGLLALALISHSAPEGALSGLIYLLAFGTEILVFCASFATWVAPFFAIPVLGKDRREFTPRFSFHFETPGGAIE
jgi:hypothetical protein